MIYCLAETYLFASEANMMLGDNATALTHINKVRTRAGTKAITNITIDSILNEQARELAFEGRRLYMLKRLLVNFTTMLLTIRDMVYRVI